jgi:hypothetical protein
MSQNDQDRRRANRVAFTMQAPVSTGSGSSGRIEDSSTLDISERGFRLRLRGQVVPDQIVNVFLNSHSEQYRVVWTSPAGTVEYLIAGLELTPPLPVP